MPETTTTTPDPTTAAAAAAVPLDVWADIACPWCFLGHRTLQQVLAADPAAAQRRHRAYLLRPDLPERGVDYGVMLTEIFGSREAAAPSEQALLERGREVGIAFDFAAIPVATNSARAHQAVLLFDDEPRQTAVLDAMYSAYWEQGVDITDPAIVASLAATAAGVDAETVALALADGAAVERLVADLSEASQLGVSAVPTVVAAGRIAVQGAQPADVLHRLIAEASA